MRGERRPIHRTKGRAMKGGGCRIWLISVVLFLERLGISCLPFE